MSAGWRRGASAIYQISRKYLIESGIQVSKETSKVSEPQILGLTLQRGKVRLFLILNVAVYLNTTLFSSQSGSFLGEVVFLQQQQQQQ